MWADAGRTLCYAISSKKQWGKHHRTHFCRLQARDVSAWCPGFVLRGASSGTGGRRSATGHQRCTPLTTWPRIIPGLLCEWIACSKGRGLARSGEHWALPLLSPLNATHVSDSASAVPSSEQDTCVSRTRRDLGSPALAADWGQEFPPPVAAGPWQ
jgi:hypothetical protein